MALRCSLLHLMMQSCLLETFLSASSNLEDSENTLYAFPSRSNMKLHNTPVIPKFVTRVLMIRQSGLVVIVFK